MKRYRPNVAAILQRPDGKILLGQRADFSDSWQFPQGGIDPGESAEAALTREVLEETGLTADAYTVAGKSGPYRYEIPKPARRKNFVGQEQVYFLCHLHEMAPEINLTGGPHPEFLSTRWIEPHDLPLGAVPPMKREVYRQVMMDLLGVGL